MARSARSVLAALGLVALGGWFASRAPAEGPQHARRWPGAWVELPSGEVLPPEEACRDERTFLAPSGDPPALTCEEARKIVAQARSQLAAPSEPIDPRRFAETAGDWLDPHGLWSVAPDAPLAASLRARAPALLRELERDEGPCDEASAVGAELSAWSGEVGRHFHAARDAARAQTFDAAEAWTLASHTPFEDGRITRTARDLARLLGRGAGALERVHGAPAARAADALAARTAPTLDATGWQEVVLAALVRAYVPQIDPHGAWAPLDEEASIYDFDLEVDPPPRLWADMTRTPLGVRIDRGARAPLEDGDVVLRVGSRWLAGMSVEQATQLSLLDDTAPTPVELLRRGEAHTREAWVGAEASLLDVTPPAPDDAAQGLSAREVPFGDGRALVVRIPDVPDDLGDRLAETLASARTGGEPAGVLLDLRGNGGGSTDGALAALGLFLPGASLFPMRRRGGDVEIDRAPHPAPGQGWAGPVAALVDGDTASAAEMIAGALAAYRRGAVVGTRTYGKGCAQEYLDDEARAGVLRLTTLVFALPDGSPLQRVGVEPQIALGVPRPLEREASLPHAPLTWRGPDVREAALVREVPWPTSAGRVGPADDVTILRALRALGSFRAASR